MKKFIILSCFITVLYNTASPQKENFKYKFYGFVRGDLYCNSRSNAESVDGLFYLFPNNILMDKDGNDLNATPNSGFYTFTTRLGIDLNGPNIGSATSSAKIETDLGGSNNINFMLRIRQAYVKLDWKGGSALTLGQTWHPLFGDVAPSMLSLCTGAPFQPFNRSPQLRYQYIKNRLKLTASALYQLIYKSTGPKGKSEEYLKNGVLPELYVGADYKTDFFIAGGGIDMISLKPRLQSTVQGNVFKVNERVTSLSYELHAKYTQNKLVIAGKTLLASNLTHAAMIGGYGATAIDRRTGECEYTPFRHSTSWLNIIYGKKYQGSIFAGYTKNLGTSKKLLDNINMYGTGLNIDRLLTLNLCARYVLPHWNMGFVYTVSTAHYGDTNLADGTVINTNGVTNHRIEGVFIYTF